jgi:cytochrome c-type biogenesis protein CcmH/NrfG
MAISRSCALLVMLASAPAWSREAASTAQCQAAAARPAIAGALVKVAKDPADLRAQFGLADAWSDAGCFNDAVNVLQNAATIHPESAELQTRLRVARSLVGEQHFFDDLDRADTQARVKLATFRCVTLSDLDACTEAVRDKPGDPVVLTAQGDALMRAQHPRDALVSYRRAEALAPDAQGVSEKISTAEAESEHRDARPNAAAPQASPVRMARTVPSPRRYSNAAAAGQTH